MTQASGSGPDTYCCRDGGIDEPLRHVLRLGVWRGVPVAANWSVALTLLPFSWLLAAGVLPETRPGDSAYTGHPAVSRVSPICGPAPGRTRVTVNGRGFFGVRSVRFGMVNGTAVKVLSSTTLSVTSPAQLRGDVNVRVATTFGTSSVVVADRYHFTRT